jgi:hypothetical protein
VAGALRDDHAGGSRQLVWILERCHDEALYDLACRGLDLGELFRGRRWAFLLAFLWQLPQTSNTKAKLADDEEFARAIIGDRNIDDLRQPGASPVSLAEFSPEVGALFDVVDRLGDVVAGLRSLSGSKGRAPRPVPRPKTAFERVATANRRQKHHELWERIKPRELTAG